MTTGLLKFYEALVLDRPRLTLALVALVTVGFAVFIPRLHLDVSADSLILEGDADLAYYRGIRAYYGGDESAIVTFTPQQDLFSPASLDQVRRLSAELLTIERVDRVTSILNVPLLQSPPLPLDQLDEGFRYLDDPDTDVELARKELVTSPLYRQNLTNDAGDTTALVVHFRSDVTYQALQRRYDQLLNLRATTGLVAAQVTELDRVKQRLGTLKQAIDQQQDRDIAAIRAILARYESVAEIKLSGAPMIISDMLAYIRHDLLVFGVAVLAVLTLVLALLFRRPRWVILPMVTAFASGLLTTGLLGLLGWPITVVSSNFLALLLIFSLSLTIHLVVRYNEVQRLHLAADQRTLVQRTLRSKAAPSFFTVLTTMVAFASLVISDIRPVVDFGWIMVIALAMTFALAFTLFPAGLMLLNAGAPHRPPGRSQRLTAAIAGLVGRRRVLILLASSVLLAGSMAGVSRLTVENRFIDYFHSSTEIYRGMLFIDRELGGTTPLELIIDAPPEPAEDALEAEFEKAINEEANPEQDPLPDDFEEFLEEDEDNPGGGIAATSYWFNSYMLERVAAVHNYLGGLDDVGKVLSLHTTLAVLQSLDERNQLDDFVLALIYRKAPEAVKKALIRPYMSEDGNQLRFVMRIHDADPSLRRAELLRDIKQQLVDELGFTPDQIHLSGMMVLYNNLLQSLFRSQILTLGAVFAVILLTFAVLFRSLLVAVLGIIPNMLAASMVLGLIGLLGIPLDIMTITIAAITIGIGVDDTIHYLHRYHTEWRLDGDYQAAVGRAHGSIGRAMYYTTLVITVGFVVMVLSNFVPTIYFGLFTAFAMLSALVANLTLLPVLLTLFKPYGVHPALASAVASSHSRKP